MKCFSVILVISLLGCASCPSKRKIDGSSVTSQCSKLNEVHFKLAEARISLEKNPESLSLIDQVRALELQKEQIELSCELARKKYHRDVERSNSFECQIKENS